MNLTASRPGNHAPGALSGHTVYVAMILGARVPQRAARGDARTLFGLVRGLDEVAHEVKASLN
jgi:hypothetical protein